MICSLYIIFYNCELLLETISSGESARSNIKHKQKEKNTTVKKTKLK